MPIVTADLAALQEQLMLAANLQAQRMVYAQWQASSFFPPIKPKPRLFQIIDDHIKTLERDETKMDVLEQMWKEREKAFRQPVTSYVTGHRTTTAYRWDYDGTALD